MKRFIAVLMLAGGLVVATVCKANISNLTTGPLDTASLITSPNQAAFVFQTGSTGGQLNGISIVLSGPSSGIFDLELWSTSSGQPSALIASVAGLVGNVASFPSGSVNNYNASDLGSVATALLSPATQYAIVLTSSSSALFFGTLTSPSYTVTNGWSYVGSLQNIGFGWGGSSTQNFVIGITTAVPIAPAPQAIPTLSEWTLMLLGLMVMTVIGWHFHRERSY